MYPVETHSLASAPSFQHSVSSTVHPILPSHPCASSYASHPWSSHHLLLHLPRIHLPAVPRSQSSWTWPGRPLQLPMVLSQSLVLTISTTTAVEELERNKQLPTFFLGSEQEPDEPESPCAPSTVTAPPCSPHSTRRHHDGSRAAPRQARTYSSRRQPRPPARLR